MNLFIRDNLIEGYAKFSGETEKEHYLLCLMDSKKVACEMILEGWLGGF